MKKLLFSLLALFFFSTLIFSQEDPKKALSKAGRALGAYNLNPTDNDAKLNEAKEMIEIAATSDEMAGQFKTWQTRGEIYNTYSEKDMAMLSMGAEANFTPKHIDAPYTAAESFEKALSLAQKKFEKKDALSGLNEAARKLNQIGNYQINKQDYAGAFKSLYKVYEVNNLLLEKGGEAVINAEEINNQKFVMAYCAQAGGNSAAAKGLFKDLYEAGTDEPSVYAQYFNILNAEEDPEALKVLEEGRTKFPENTEILFAQINHLIQKGDYKKLETVLQDAVKAEPNNPSVRSALGNVYMNLFTDEYSVENESDLSKDYFAKSLDYFNQAIELEPKQFDALYSIGSLYFNKAVEIIKVANELPLDQSKKYDAMTKEANGLMETALPYFKNAESLNANDMNTLIALGEIFARMNDFEKSGEFKKRLQTLKDGGTNEASYFNN